MAPQNHNTARAVGRVLGKKSRQNKYVRGGISAAGTTLRATARTGRILWLQVIGLLCAIFAISLSAQLWREYQQRNISEHSEIRIFGAALLLAIFIWIAVSSFWRARQLKRSGTLS